MCRSLVGESVVDQRRFGSGVHVEARCKNDSGHVEVESAVGEAETERVPEQAFLCAILIQYIRYKE